MDHITHIEPKLYDQAIELNDLSIYHSSNWHDFLRSTFNWNVQAYIEKDAAGQLVCFLPFVEKRRATMKKVRVTLPLSHDVGIAYRSDADRSRLVDQLSAENINIEIHAPIEHPQAMRIHKNDITQLNLAQFESSEELYSTFHKKRIKYPINRARKSDIVVESEPTPRAVEDFYQLELMTRKRQGSPLYPKDFFTNLFRELSQREMIKIWVAYHQEKPISGIIIFLFNKRCIHAYSASVSDGEIKKLGANELLLWSGLEYAKDRGIETFDFGTTPSALPQLKWFKEKWGGESVEHPYSIITQSERKVSQGPSRDGALVKLTSMILRAVPTPIFERVSPWLLKTVV